MNVKPSIVALAVTGASGIQYSRRLLQCLLEADVQVYVMFSKAAQIVAAMETDWALPGRPSDIESQLQSEFRVAPDQLRVFG